MCPAIDIRALRKSFGAFAAVDGLDLEVPVGSVFGFLGPNGAGKTTTIRVLTGLARPDSGVIKVLGEDVVASGRRLNERLGYLPETPAFYGWMTAAEYLEFCADIFRLTGDERRERIASLLEFAGLAEVKRPIAGFSRGMKQRLGLAQALINDPELLFLDEPTSALDPIGRKEVLEMIASLADEKTVFFSTHILADVERVCDRVAVINKGRSVIQADLETLKAEYLEPAFLLEFNSKPDLFTGLLPGLPWVADVAADGHKVTVRVRDPLAAQVELPKLVARTGLGLRQFQRLEPSLEDIFMKVLA